MIFFCVKNDLSLIRAHLFHFSFVTFALGDRTNYNPPVYVRELVSKAKVQWVLDFA